MATKAFPKLLKSAIMGGAPFGFIAPSFSKEAAIAKEEQKYLKDEAIKGKSI